MPWHFTKNQILILEIFFNKPDQPHYLREIAQLLGKKPGVFQRDINNLATDGLLTSYFEANRRFFKLNKKYPLYKEMKSIFFKTLGVKGLLKQELENIPEIKEAFIYGSFARNQEKDASDIDVFIIGSVSENVIMDLFNKLERKLDRELNYVLMTDKEFKEKSKQKNSFLANVMKNKKIELL